MVKDHSDSERGNLLPPHGLLFLINRGFFYMHHPTDRIAHTMAIVTPVMEHWLDREIAQWVQTIKDRSDNPSHHERTLLPWSYILLLIAINNHNHKKDFGFEQYQMSCSEYEYRVVYKHDKCVHVKILNK